MEGYSDKVKQCMFGIVGMLIAIIVGMLLSGCTTPKVITVPEVHHEYHHTSDTVYKVDSIKSEKKTTIRELDSAAMAKYGIQLKNAEKAWLIETNELKFELNRLKEYFGSVAERVDSIPVPYPVEKKVPAEINGWQWFQIWAGRIALGILLLAVVVIVTRRYLKKKIIL